MKNNKKILAQQEKDRYIEDLISSVTEDYLSRREERASLERQWELNLSFMAGKQYVDISPKGDIIESDKEFYWQARGVFNHIAPLIEARLAKLSLVKPIVSVRPSGDDAKEIENARLAETVLSATGKKISLDDVVLRVTRWSEICGTGFYKVLWDPSGGERLGVTGDGEVFEGEVTVIPVSPFEIYPDSLKRESLADCKSVIHAKSVDVGDIKAKYGVTVNPEKDPLKEEDKLNTCVVIERYELPSKKFPNGRLVTVGGNELLFIGELPYLNGKNGERFYPFVRQVSAENPGQFFGCSVVEKLIPVQRAYNAVKNRKHEFMNRITMGVMTVEDGSVDVNELVEEGLSPGKVVIYRQGATPPEMMKETTIPEIFGEEEEKLLNEFVIISSVSDVVSAKTERGVSSGTALEILVSQDNERMIVSAEAVRNSYMEISRQILKLYKQFITGVRAVKNIDEDARAKIIYVDKEVMTADDVFLDSENELMYTPRQKKEMLLSLYSSGLLFGDDGKLSATVKEKLLSLLGYKHLDSGRGIAKLQENKAGAENPAIRMGEFPIEDVDNDAIHVEEHTRYYLSEYENLTETEKKNILQHVSLHKKRIDSQNKADA